VGCDFGAPWARFRSTPVIVAYRRVAGVTTKSTSDIRFTPQSARQPKAIVEPVTRETMPLRASSGINQGSAGQHHLFERASALTGRGWRFFAESRNRGQRALGRSFTPTEKIELTALKQSTVFPCVAERSIVNGFLRRGKSGPLWRPAGITSAAPDRPPYDTERASDGSGCCENRSLSLSDERSSQAPSVAGLLTAP
jgi:hypothetical protein